MPTTAAPTTRGRTRKLLKAGPDRNVIQIPDKSWHERYVPRTISGKTDYDIFDHCLHTARNVLLEGPTGTGKTSLCLAYAARRRLNYYSMPSGSSAEPGQIFGKWVQNPDGSGWLWVDGPATQIVRYGGLLLTNEINFMPSHVMSTLFGLFDRRREIVLVDKHGEVIRAHRPAEKNIHGRVVSQCWCDAPDSSSCRSKWVLLAADMNPDYLGTRPLNEALRNRFGMKLDWGYDKLVEARLVMSKTLRELADALRADYEKRAYSCAPSTSMLVDFEHDAVNLGLDLAFDSFVNCYPGPERGKVRMILDTNRGDIENDLKKATEQKDGVPDFSNWTDAEIEQWRLTLKPGDVDPEWGVYTTDWEWEDAEED